MYRKYLCFYIVVSFLFGCVEQRNETPQLFSKKTGIALCTEARVKNIKVGNYDYETDFVYSVRISSNKKCIKSFYKRINNDFGVNCQNRQICEFVNEKSWSYKVMQIRDGVIMLTLNAI